MNTQETEAANLNLDTSVLIDKNSRIRRVALMDLYGLRVLDQDIEKRIEEYQQKEQRKNDFYKTIVFQNEQDMVDKELDIIREHVFFATYTSAQSMVTREQSDNFRQYAGITVGMVLLILLIGLCYGKFKQSKREKRLADINDSYDE